MNFIFFINKSVNILTTPWCNTKVKISWWRKTMNVWKFCHLLQMSIEMLFRMQNCSWSTNIIISVFFHNFNIYKPQYGNTANSNNLLALRCCRWFAGGHFEWWCNCYVASVGGFTGPINWFATGLCKVTGLPKV